jgi:hypothetical protein
MKTSTIIATFAVACGFITVTATNLKLKSEYNKGKLQDPYIKKALPSFRYIKDITDTGTLKQGYFQIHAGDKEVSSVAQYYSFTSSFIFSVANDTLYISLDKSNTSRYANSTPIIIRTNRLESIEMNNGEYELTSGNTNSLNISAKRRSKIDVKLDKADTLTIFANSNGSVGVASKENGVIKKLKVRLEDKSSFNAKNLIIDEPNLQVGPYANLQVSGLSIESFKIKNSQ